MLVYVYALVGTSTSDFVAKEEGGERWIEGIVSAEVLDKQGEITVRDELLKALHKMLKTSRAMPDTHTNRIVGEWHSFDPILIKDRDGTQIPAIRGKGKIFDTPIGDSTWEKIKNGHFRGFSFGGATHSPRVPTRTRDGRTAFKLKDLESWEVSICQSPAVPIALVMGFNKLAKTYDAEELAKMEVIEKDDGSSVVRCTGNVCYVDRSLAAIAEDKPKDVSKEIVGFNTSQAVSKAKEMVNEEITTPATPVEKAAPAVDVEAKLAETLGTVNRFVQASEKHSSEIAGRLDRLESYTSTRMDRMEDAIGKMVDSAHESPPPANGSTVPAKDDYVETPNVSENAGNKDDASDEVKLEESKKAVTPEIDYENASAADLLSTIKPSQILAKAREQPHTAAGISNVANMIREGMFGDIRPKVDAYQRLMPAVGGGFV